MDYNLLLTTIAQSSFTTNVIIDFRRIKMFFESIDSTLISALVTGFFVLISVYIGFRLSERAQTKRDKERIVRLKRMIIEELKSIKSQIPDKVNIINQIFSNWDKQKTLSARSVGIINIVYKSHATDIYEHLSDLERSCLHVIHEHLDKAEEKYELYDEECRTAFRTNKQFDDIIYRYKNHFKDILSSYSMVINLIDSYLSGKPEDVFHTKERAK